MMFSNKNEMPKVKAAITKEYMLNQVMNFFKLFYLEGLIKSLIAK